MGRPPKQRQPRTSIKFSEADGRYHAWVTVGITNGQPDQRHRSSKDYDEVVQKVLKLEDQVDANAVPPVGASEITLKTWLEGWYTKYAPRRSGYNALAIRRWAIFQHLIPGLGESMLDALTTDAIEDFYWKCYDEGLAPKSIELLHETLSIALEKARSKKYIPENPATAAERPEPEEIDFEPPTAEEIVRILTVIMRRPDRARWCTQMLGPRQGEALGLHVVDFELADRMITVRGKLQRRTYRHGCENPAACAKPHCKTASCTGPWEHGCADARACAERHCKRPTYPSDIKRGIRTTPCEPGCTGHARGCPKRRRGACNRHKRECPPPCEPGCTGHARHCPDRSGGLMVIEPEASATQKQLERQERHRDVARPRRTTSRRQTKRGKRITTKSKAGRRRFAIPGLFLPVIEQHFAELEQRRLTLGTKWRGIGLAFCGPFGQPIDPRRDWETWCDILVEADVEHMPLHWTRHIAASLLLAAGVDARVVMDIMGWSDARMLQRYQHVADELRRDAADRLGGFLGGYTTRTTTGPQIVDVIASIEKGPGSSEMPALGA